MRIERLCACESKMAAYRRAFVDASKLLKQGSKLTRAHCKTVLQTQVRSLTVQRYSLVKGATTEMSLGKQGHQKFATIPRIMSSALLTTMTTTADTGLINSDSSGSSEVLEGSSNDEEGLVTPLIDSKDDL